METQLERLVQLLGLKVAPKPAKVPVAAPTAEEKAAKAAKRKAPPNDAEAGAAPKSKKVKTKGDRADKPKGVKADRPKGEKKTKGKKQKREQ